MRIFAHRGYCGLYPENTMIAFIKAHEAMSDGIELDVQLTKDGEVVIIHDEKVDRTTDKKGFVCDYTLKELQTLNAAVLFPNITPFASIPTFREYCEWVRATDLITNIELKTGIIYYPELEQKVINILNEYKLLEKVIISSFNPLSLVETQRIDQTIPLALLVEEQGLVNAGYLCKQSGFFYYHPNIREITKKGIEECTSHGIEVNIWTANTEEDINHCIAIGAVGIFTNYPKEMREILNRL